VENRFYRVMSGAGKLKFGPWTAYHEDMLMGRGPFEGVDNQLQYPPQVYQQIAIAGTRAW
jgi:hypothetical protein